MLLIRWHFYEIALATQRLSFLRLSDDRHDADRLDHAKICACPARNYLLGTLWGLFLTLGMARLRYWGSFTLVMLPFILLMLRFSWIIAIYLSVPLICTELLALRRGGYQIKQTRLLAIVTFFASTTFLAIVSAGIIRGGRWAVLLAQPLWLIGLTLGAMIVATIGWAIGELLVRQLWIE